MWLDTRLRGEFKQRKLVGGPWGEQKRLLLMLAIAM